MTAAKNCLGGRRLDPQERFAANLLFASYDPLLPRALPPKLVQIVKNDGGSPVRHLQLQSAV